MYGSETWLKTVKHVALLWKNKETSEHNWKTWKDKRVYGEKNPENCRDQKFDENGTRKTKCHQCFDAVGWVTGRASLKSSGMASVNEGSHSFTCHPYAYPQVEWTIPAFTAQLQSITALWLVLISRPAEGSRLSWPGWLGEILRWFARQRQSPIPVLTGLDVE